MAHEITETDKVISYMDAGWHGLATVKTEWPSLEEVWRDAYGWEPVSETLYRMVPSISDTGDLKETFEAIDSHKLVVRSDNNYNLGVVSHGHELVLNQQLLEIVEALEKDTRTMGQPVRIETAGSLKGGKKVWALLRLEEPLKVKGDPRGDTIPYYGIQNSHDGMGALRGQVTMVRIICANTAHASDLDARARGTDFAFRHTKNIQQKIEDAKLALAGWREGITQWSEMADYLSTVKVTNEQRQDFVEAFIPLPVTEKVVSDRVRNNVLTARTELRDILSGPTQDYIDMTAFGLVQGAVEWSQHVRGTKGKNDRDRAENRFRRAYLDKNALTRSAMDVMKMVVPV